MENRHLFAAAAFAGLLLALASGCSASTQPPSPSPTQKKEAAMPTHASGTFEVKLNPLAVNEEDSVRGRMSIDKQFHGDLEATSQGEMLTAMSSVKGSAGYVAIERVSGTLKGRKGSFVLQHTGIMNRGEPSLTITVVPDSGTDELAGLTGKMSINVADGKHSYDFEYTFAEKP
jgi:hypothetical protein